MSPGCGILPSVCPRRAGILPGIGWTERLKSPLFAGPVENPEVNRVTAVHLFIATVAELNNQPINYLISKFKKR